MKTPKHVRLPIRLEQANEQGLVIEDAGRLAFATRWFTDDDRKMYREFMQEDLEKFRFIIEAVNAHDALVDLRDQVHRCFFDFSGHQEPEDLAELKHRLDVVDAIMRQQL
jgi:hypothetical protein